MYLRLELRIAAAAVPILVDHSYVAHVIKEPSIYLHEKANEIISKVH